MAAEPQPAQQPSLAARRSDSSRVATAPSQQRRQQHQAKSCSAEIFADFLVQPPAREQRQCQSLRAIASTGVAAMRDGVCEHAHANDQLAAGRRCGAPAE